MAPIAIGAQQSHAVSVELLGHGFRAVPKWVLFAH
jgi:hypothetical protein